MLGNGDRAYPHSTQVIAAAKNDLIEVRECEPYVYVQNLLGDGHPQFGLARNSWLTGTASWCNSACASRKSQPNTLAMEDTYEARQTEPEGLRFEGDEAPRPRTSDRVVISPAPESGHNIAFTGGSDSISACG